MNYKRWLTDGLCILIHGFFLVFFACMFKGPCVGELVNQVLLAIFFGQVLVCWLILIVSAHPSLILLAIAMMLSAIVSYFEAKILVWIFIHPPKAENGSAQQKEIW